MPLDGDRPVLERRPLGGLVERERRRLAHQERHRDVEPDGLLGRLAGVGVERAHVELVAPAAQVDLGGPLAGRVGGDAVRVAAGRRDVDGRAGDRHAAQRVRGRGVVDLDDRGGRVGDRDGRRLREAEQLHARGRPTNTSTPTVIRARTTRNGENVRPFRGVAIGRGTVMTGAVSRWVARTHAATGRGPRPRRDPGRGRSCAGSPSCRRRRGAPSSRRARARRGTGRGSSCRARRGTDRRPCAHGPRRAARGARGPGRRTAAASRGVPRGRHVGAGRVSSSVSRRRPRRRST